MCTFILNSSLLTLKKTSDSVRWRKVLGRSTRTKCKFPGKEPWKREERNVLAIIQSVRLCIRQNEKIKKDRQPYVQVSHIFCVCCKNLYHHFHENPNLKNTFVKNKTPNVMFRLYSHFSIITSTTFIVTAYQLLCLLSTSLCFHKEFALLLFSK